MLKLILVSLAALPLSAQTFGVDGVSFQALGNPVLQGARVLDEGFGNRTVKGKPFSATEERHSLQVLGDGTRIENMQTNRLYRDAEGRTRVEEMNGTITIYDSVTNTRVTLDPATKQAYKGGAMTRVFLGSGDRFGGYATEYGNFLTATSTPRPGGNNVANMQGVMSETTENLGTQNVNGVNATGVRTTMIIPKGQIGNNRDIKVMTERWSSNDLQMLVKSVNSDPRFGDTTYQLTKITQSAPDAALFQIPPDYTVTEVPGAFRSVTLAPKAKQRPGVAIPAPGPAKEQ